MENTKGWPVFHDTLQSGTQSDIFKRQFPVFFIESYKEFIEYPASSDKIEGCSKFAGESDFTPDFVSGDDYCSVMNVTDELCRRTLKNPFFSGFDVKTEEPSDFAIKDRNRGTGVDKSGRIDSVSLVDNSHGDYWKIGIAKGLIRKPHRMLISSSLYGTFMSITVLRSMPFFLREDSTSETESPDTTIPLPVTATHLPLYFSTSSGCEDNHSSSCITIKHDLVFKNIKSRAMRLGSYFYERSQN
ncbi:hypothetical protein HYZ41_03910 [archaeon]|nr:hypothetical protein [archaeon]